jgi:hypothetical protein
MSDRYRSRRKAPLGAVLVALVLVLVSAVDSSAQIEIGFCQGTFGVFETFTICFIVCCPGDLVPTVLCATTTPVNCGDAAAVMGAIDAALATMVYGGNPVFGTPVVVPTPIPGQARHGYPLDAGFAADGCCVIGGSRTFQCGTVSLRINEPCAKGGGGGGGGGGPIKIQVFGPAPAFPTSLVIQFIGCPPVIVPLAGGESPDTVKLLVLAALSGAGFTAFINADGDVEVTFDCTGAPPLGVDEFGLAGGVAMDLGLVVCPPPPPIGTEERSWGELKGLYSEPR